MNKRKTRLLFISIICGTMLIILFISVNQGKVRIGFGEKEQIELGVGNYNAIANGIKGEYAIIAISGNGNVFIKGERKQELSLDDALYIDVQNRAPQVLNQVLYEEGEKVEIHKEDIVIVEGDESFKIRLIKR